MPRRCGGDDMSAARSGHLHREATDPARGAVDQYALARLKIAMLEQRLPRRQRRKRNRGGVDVIERSRLGREIGRRCTDKLRKTSIMREINQAEDLITN